MCEAAASCKDIALAPVTNWEPQCVTLAGYGYAVRHGLKVQLVTSYRASHLQRYGVTIRGNVTSVYPPLQTERSAEQKVSFHHFLNCDKSPDKGTANKQEKFQPSKYSSE